MRGGHPLQARSLTAEAVHAMSLDPHRAPELELVASCYRMLYYLVWDHPDNWQPFSNGPTLRFLFAQMNELARVYVRGEPLNWWVCKLLEEIIVDNSEANRLTLTLTLALPLPLTPGSSLFYAHTHNGLRTKPQLFAQLYMCEV